MEPLKAYKIIVRGVVQGVLFRASARNEAEEFGLKGYVKNLPEGNALEIVVTGEADEIEKFIRWCRLGPDFAKVDEVEVNQIIIEKEFEDFKIIYD